MNFDKALHAAATYASPPDLEELWGILLAYNLVRLEMESIANQEMLATQQGTHGCAPVGGRAETELEFKPRF